MADWLVGETVVRPNGEVMSWVNPNHPGYAYLEAGGLWLRWAALRSVVPELRRDVATRLRAAVDDDCVGRDGVRYAFDAGVVLAGLDAARHAEDPQTSDHWNRLERQISVGVATVPQLEARWSTRVGPHFRKLAVGALQPATGCTSDLPRVLGAIDLRMSADGRIPTSPDGSTYVHAHAYAVEGLLALAHTRSPLPSEHKQRCTEAAHRGARWLAAVQRTNGGLPASHGGDHGIGPTRSDATAQAIRIWLLTGSSHFAPAIETAVAFLRGVTTDVGGVRYDDATDDLNTWATLFAEQALSWAQGEAADALALL